MKICRVVTPGFFSTVQDLGRYGYQRFGVPVSGAMDTYALTAANLLVGNKREDACLEMTLLGPRLEFLKETLISITGAALSPVIGGAPVCCWQTLQVGEGDVLSFGAPQSGCRAYLAVRGGIDVPMVMGSRSTYVRGGFGGFQGRKMKTGDVIEAHTPRNATKSGRFMPKEFIPRYSRAWTIDVVLGPQSHYLTDSGLDDFFSSFFTVAAESDRMGYRLDGARVAQKSSLKIVSDAIPVGAIQVPPSGKPIVVMRDGQTTGGYPKVAMISTPDISRIGQAKSSDKIRFTKISLGKAQTKLLKYRRNLRDMKTQLIETKL
ncbi:MAG: biotin-dependent carboxyltransferase family protein [Candidatus Bathyarchaeota archaeon]|nr:MAG: biotin-dependent carboxyltransferase family protein [Candidatus Bathyarchaeota archaeon]